MADPLDTHPAILVHLEYLRQGIDGINERLDVQNGRVRKNEQSIAVLEDRATEARRSGAVWGGSIGAGAGAAVAALWHLLNGKP